MKGVSRVSDLQLSSQGDFSFLSLVESLSV